MVKPQGRLLGGNFELGRSVLTLRAALADGTSVAGLVTGTAAEDPAGPVFVFPGQGAQWWGMGRDLLTTSEAFRARNIEK